MKMHRRTCAQCGKEFFASHHAERMCSDECRAARKADEQRRRLSRKQGEDREAMRAKWREAQRRRREKYPEKTKTAQAAWTAANRDRVNAAMRERRAENPAYAEKQHAWRQRNAARLREYDRKRRERAKELRDVVQIVGDICDLLATNSGAGGAVKVQLAPKELPPNQSRLQQ
jgi:hypothetical protein